MPPKTKLTGRCYCAAISFETENALETIAYCHCDDCRRWTGAPVAAFASFTEASMNFTPSHGSASSFCPGVRRWACPECGSPIAAAFDYLPGQLYIPLGLIDQAADLPPRLHCHSDAQLPWLHISDNLPRVAKSGRAVLLGK